VKLLPGFAPVLGATEQEARKRDKELAELVIPERGLGLLEAFTRMDFSGDPLDEPVRRLPELDTFQGGIARMRLVHDYVRREKPTLRELAQWFANGIRGHAKIVGTPEQLAALMEDWFVNKAADGFNLLFPLSPSGLEEFCRDVVPILQERGIFRTEYEGTTLREHYGVPAPVRATQLTEAGG
jgi:alkanesulfonate monooxygenase SsuD/methylene tetrahydromethanopterin reductase-like flavin-dependent oxidoreductase (luciferase family)